MTNSFPSPCVRLSSFHQINSCGVIIQLPTILFIFSLVIFVNIFDMTSTIVSTQQSHRYAKYQKHHGRSLHSDMSRNYPANTHVQKFLEQSYDKERDARLGWHFQSKKTGETANQSTQLDVFRKKIEAACPKPTEGLLKLRKLKPKSYHKRIINYDDKILAQIAKQTKNATLTVDMQPAEERIKSKLYDGFTKEGKGRHQYLQCQYQKIPEDKYRYPLLSSWEYGWRLGDVVKAEDIHKPDNGRTRIVADTFYTRTGIPQLHCSATF